MILRILCFILILGYVILRKGFKIGENTCENAQKDAYNCPLSANHIQCNYEAMFQLNQFTDNEFRSCTNIC